MCCLWGPNGVCQWGLPLICDISSCINVRKPDALNVKYQGLTPLALANIKSITPFLKIVYAGFRFYLSLVGDS